jgi:hypothetical protein
MRGKAAERSNVRDLLNQYTGRRERGQCRDLGVLPILWQGTPLAGYGIPDPGRGMRQPGAIGQWRFGRIPQRVPRDRQNPRLAICPVFGDYLTQAIYRILCTSYDYCI